MNTFLKVCLAILGACNTLFSLFIPLAVGLLWILKFGTGTFGSSIIIILALLSTLYRAVNYLTIKEQDGRN